MKKSIKKLGKRASGWRDDILPTRLPKIYLNDTVTIGVFSALAASCSTYDIFFKRLIDISPIIKEALNALLHVITHPNSAAYLARLKLGCDLPDWFITLLVKRPMHEPLKLRLCTTIIEEALEVLAAPTQDNWNDLRNMLEGVIKTEFDKVAQHKAKGVLLSI